MKPIENTCLDPGTWAAGLFRPKEEDLQEEGLQDPELDSLLDYIWEAPPEQLPHQHFLQTAALLRRSLPEFAHAFLKEHLNSLCSRAALSGRLRRLPRRTSFSRSEELDFVVTPHGYNGKESSLDGSALLGFLRCYQLLWFRGSARIKLRFSAALGLYHYSLLTLYGRVRIWVVPPERFGIALLLTTGPQRHLGLLSLRARRLGCSALMPEGLYTAAHQLRSAEEEDIYEALGLEWIAPESRDGEKLPV
ncbi:MAG: hypothetical protein M0Q48_10310 [Verrucomicrobia bacterium]|nr:hypothetical protein [Verrucomicrobiota bacterium]